MEIKLFKYCLLRIRIKMMSNLYSDETNQENVDEVIVFDELPRKLRVQFNFIIKDIFGLLKSYKD